MFKLRHYLERKHEIYIKFYNITLWGNDMNSESWNGAIFVSFFYKESRDFKGGL